MCVRSGSAARTAPSRASVLSPAARATRSGRYGSPSSSSSATAGMITTGTRRQSKSSERCGCDARSRACSLRSAQWPSCTASATPPSPRCVTSAGKCATSAAWTQAPSCVKFGVRLSGTTGRAIVRCRHAKTTCAVPCTCSLGRWSSLIVSSSPISIYAWRRTRCLGCAGMQEPTSSPSPRWLR